MTVLAPFASRVAAHAARPALIAADGREFSYGRLAGWSDALARRWMRRGVGPGSRVLVARGPSPFLYASLMALWRLGATAVFPEPASGLRGLRHALRVAAPEYFLGSPMLAVLVAALAGRPRLAVPLPDCGDEGCPARDPSPWPADTPALLSFTSGSTGAPKTILRTHGTLLAQLEALAPLLQTTQPGRDLVALPLFVLANLALGVATVLPDADLRRPAAETAPLLAAQIGRCAVDRLLAPPALAGALAGQPQFARLRHVFTGGGPVWPDLMRTLTAAAPLAAVTAVYGATEAEPVAALSVCDLTAADWSRISAGNGLPAGHPVPGVALRIEADEILVSGRHVVPAPGSPGGWHRTGDAGRLDAQGRLWLLGRLAGRAGTWFPFQVEVAAFTWPGVAQAALVEAGGVAHLALAGAPGRADEWRARARAFPDLHVTVLESIPLDRRHRSKTDYAALRGLLGA